MKKRVKSVFADENQTDALNQIIEQSVQRIKAISAAYIDETLDPSQYEQAIKSLNFAQDNLDDAQSAIEESLSGKEDYAQVLDESSVASTTVHNIAVAKMSASMLCSSIMGDMEENMTLDDALDVPDDEIDDADDADLKGVVESPEKLLTPEMNASLNTDDAVVVPPVSDPSLVDDVILDNPDVVASVNSDDIVPVVEAPVVPDETVPVAPIEVASVNSNHSMGDLAAKVRTLVLS